MWLYFHLPQKDYLQMNPISLHQDRDTWMFIRGNLPEGIEFTWSNRYIERIFETHLPENR